MASPPSGQTAATARWIETVVEGLAADRRASAFAILVVALCCFLPGLSTIPPVDRDEPRYADTARHMVATGDLLDARFDDRTAVDLAVGTVWLEAATAGAAGGGRLPIWVYRLPSFASAVAAALLTWWTALAFGRPRAALFAGLFMAANLILAGEARLARPDATLLAAIVAAEGALARLWLGSAATRGREAGLAALLWAATGAGVLVAGPVAPLVVGLTGLVLTLAGPDRSWLHRLRPAWGVPLMLFVAAPLVLPLIAGRGGIGAGGLFAAGDGLAVSLPPGTYGLLFFALAWPGASFFVLAVPWMLERLKQPAILFGAAWSVPWWLVAELAPLKLAPFILPALPAVALLAATAVDRGQITTGTGMRRFFALGPLLFALMLALGAPLVVVFAGDGVPWPALPALGLGGATAAVAWAWLQRGAAIAAAGLAVAASVPLFAGLFGFLLPDFDRLDVSRRVLAQVPANSGCAAPRFVAAGYGEPSLTFLAPTRIRVTDGAGAANFLNAGLRCRFAVVENRQLSSFRQRAEDLGLDLVNLGRVPGISLGAGRRVTVQVFRPETAP